MASQRPSATTSISSMRLSHVKDRLSSLSDRLSSANLPSLAVDTSELPPKGPKGIPMNATLLLIITIFATTFASGGLILASSTLAKRLIDEALLDGSGVNTFFNLAYQLLGWGSVLWVVLWPSIGIRLCATLGLLVACVGNLMLYFIIHQRSTSPNLYGFSLGLIGAGGNAVMLLCVEAIPPLFAKNRQAFAMAMYPGAFKLSGFVWFLLNDTSIALDGFYLCYALFTLLIAISMFVLLPDRPYRAGDQASITWPCCLFESPVSSLRKAFAHAAPHLKTGIFWSFCFTFCWCQALDAWAEGVAASTLLWPSAPISFYQWWEPSMLNFAGILQPIVGILIDIAGLWIAIVILLVSATAVPIVVWIAGDCTNNGDDCMMWTTMSFLLVVGSFLFVIEFAYIGLTFPKEAFTGLLIVVLATSNIIGFVNWPFLTELQPFGEEPSSGNAIFFLVPTLFCFAWPLWWYQGERSTVGGSGDAPDANNIEGGGEGTSQEAPV